jgi:hypothetical protein
MANRGRQSVRRCARRVSTLAALPLLALQAVPLPAAETVQSLRYGASLYHYYQRDYPAAITELTAAQQLDALGPHTEGSNLMLGGMVLSYGMDRAAQDIFESELEEPRDSVDADRAWFYLGKLAWQRGDARRAAQALDNMAPGYDGAAAEEARYLRANAALALQDNTTATQQKAALPDASRWRHYLDYDLGAAFAARGDWHNATTHFSALATAPADTPEADALRDRSLTAAGYAHLAAGELQQSGDAFRQVRLDSPYANRALLGYGWSSAQRGDYLAALSPWQQLSSRSMLDESARESLLAVPYAYAQLGRPGLSLQHYRHASERYAAELAALDAAIDAFETQPLAPLLGIADEGDADWLFDAGVLPGGDHSPYLQHLASRHGFQLALKELRDLYGIAAHLARAEERLQVLQHVDTHQQQVWASIVEEGRRDALAARHEELVALRSDLHQRLQQALVEPGGRLLADAAQGRRWARLEKATRLSASLDTSKTDAEHRLRVLRGLLIWEDNEHYPARAWQARRDLEALDTLVEKNAEALARVDTAIAGRRQSDFSPRIAALAEQVMAQSASVAITIAGAENGLRQVAVAELQRQGEQLARALGQSRLAIAQIHDNATIRGDGDE